MGLLYLKITVDGDSEEKSQSGDRRMNHFESVGSQNQFIACAKDRSKYQCKRNKHSRGFDLGASS